MKIVAINGSPKASGSTSAKIIGQVEKIMGEQIEVYRAAKLVSADTSRDIIAGMLDADVLMLVFPLYVDSLHASLIELLKRIEISANNRANLPRVYTIVNCGFFESSQTALALEIVEHFANRAGLPWGYGLGVGGGPILSGLGESWEKGPAAIVHQALLALSAAMRENRSGQNAFVSPKFPRFLYKAMGNYGFRYEARRNKIRNLRLQPYKEKPYTF